MVSYPQATNIWIIKAIIVKRAMKRPIFPISAATLSNLIYNGVCGASSYNLSLSFPFWVFTPTAATNIIPDPSIHFEPEIMNGVDLFPLE